MASERDRLEVRLDPENRRKLDAVCRARGGPVSRVVRELIDEAYEDVLRERRRRAVEVIASLEIEEMPDPDELSRQLDSTYDVDLP
jgi:predicted DNA-binding protein